jgi:GSH-dependent disulfide-bond oxidoreductase
MLKFYFYPSTNPMKVALFLEESRLDYQMVPVEIRKGEQFLPEYLAINPNAKTPALVDGETKVFDSTAILLYLGAKTGQFMSDGTPSSHAQMLSWLMFIASGIGPFSGQAVYFQYFGKEVTNDALNRYLYEAKRHWEIIDAHLAQGRYMLGEKYSIADMSLWGWARALPRVLGEHAWDICPNVKRLVEEIGQRPASGRATALASKYEFKTEMDEEATGHMFRYRALMET